MVGRPQPREGVVVVMTGVSDNFPGSRVASPGIDVLKIW